MPANTVDPNVRMYNVSSFILPTSKSVFFFLSFYVSFIPSCALSFAVFSVQYVWVACVRACVCVCVFVCVYVYVYVRALARLRMTKNNWAPILVRDLLEMRVAVQSTEKKETRSLAKNSLQTK
jgi:hypothetical protein